MSYEFIQTSVQDGVASIVLNRPPLNILHIAMMQEINAALKAMDPQSVKLLVFKAEGKAFSGGVEVAEHLGGTATRMIKEFHAMFRNMDALAVPSIAAVNGAALGGGCELAVYCDMVIASEKAKIGQPEIQVGVFPPIASLIFPRIMGRKKAMELILSGDILSAQESKDLGLVNQVVPHEQFQDEAEAFIAKFAAMSGPVLQYARSATLAGLTDQDPTVLKTIEDLYLNGLMQTEDAIEGLQAFLDKRKPVWQGK